MHDTLMWTSKGRGKPVDFPILKRTLAACLEMQEISHEIKSSYIPTFKVTTCSAKIFSQYSFETD